MNTHPFDLQGHRGARGLKPENTLLSFEVAIDVGVTSIETDLHLTRDGIPVLVHDPMIETSFPNSVWERRPGRSQTEFGNEVPPAPLPISELTLVDLRSWRANRNPDPARFPCQDAIVTPLAASFALERGIDPFTPPTLDELFSFARAYAAAAGQAAGKSEAQRHTASKLRYDLELKRVPLWPETIGDSLNEDGLGLLEQRLLQSVEGFDLWDRVSVRSFDHRCVLALKRQCPQLRTAVLVARTALVDPVAAVRHAQADCYCPDYQFVDQPQVRQLHDAGISVVPWTVNDEADWQRLLAWGVDGITTDYPDRLARFLRALQGP
jgi:glycerophosphoryl diester phosphodiesterase